MAITNDNENEAFEGPVELSNRLADILMLRLGRKLLSYIYISMSLSLFLSLSIYIEIYRYR